MSEAPESALWLLIDSAGGAPGAPATLALCREERVVARRTVDGRGFSSQWTTLLRDLLADASVAVGALQFVGVVHGPGSFTGVRVGLAAAKGICVAADIPLVTVSSLAVMMTATSAGAAVMDAGRGEFFVRVGDGESLMLHAAVGAVLEGKVVAVDREATAESLGLSKSVFPGDSGEAAAALLWEAWQSGERADVASADANYVRGEGQLYARRSS